MLLLIPKCCLVIQEPSPAASLQIINCVESWKQLNRKSDDIKMRLRNKDVSIRLHDLDDDDFDMFG